MLNLAKIPELIKVNGFRANNQIFLDGVELLPTRSMLVWRHASEFNWGYGGSGPAQLSLAILLEYLPREYAIKYHQPFKFDVIARFPQGRNFQADIKLRQIISKIMQSK